MLNSASGPLQQSFLSFEMTGRCYSLWPRTCSHSRHGTNNWWITNLFHAKRQDCFTRLPFFSLPPFPSTFHTITLSFPKGNMEEGEHGAWKGLLIWVELESHPGCSISQSLDGPALVRKAITLLLPGEAQSSQRIHHSSILLLCFETSFQVENGAWQILRSQWS